jgi:hypothetical protein
MHRADQTTQRTAEISQRAADALRFVHRSFGVIGVLCGDTGVDTVFFGNGFPSVAVILTPPPVFQGDISEKGTPARNPGKIFWKNFRKGTPGPESCGKMGPWKMFC